MALQPTMLPVSVDQLNVLLNQVCFVTQNYTMVQEIVTKLLIPLHIHKLKVVHVVWYLEELVLRIKQRVRLRQVILVLVRQRRMKCRIRTVHRAVSGTAMAICTTTQNPPPQHPVPPPDPVSAYLYRNAHKPMEMNQTVLPVSVDLLNVLLLVLIAIKLVVLVE